MFELRNSFAIMARQVFELPAAGAKLGTPGCRRPVLAVSGIRYLEADRMNDLRMYKNIEVPETFGGFPVFYSRREDGPYYRWVFNDFSQQWQAGRVLPSASSPKAFVATTWKEIPALLKTSIADHYQD